MACFKRGSQTPQNNESQKNLTCLSPRDNQGKIKTRKTILLASVKVSHLKQEQTIKNGYPNGTLTLKESKFLDSSIAKVDDKGQEQEVDSY